MTSWFISQAATQICLGAGKVLTRCRQRPGVHGGMQKWWMQHQTKKQTSKSQTVPKSPSDTARSEGLHNSKYDDLQDAVRAWLRALRNVLGQLATGMLWLRCVRFLRGQSESRPEQHLPSLLQYSGFTWQALDHDHKHRHRWLSIASCILQMTLRDFDGSSRGKCLLKITRRGRLVSKKVVGTHLAQVSSKRPTCAAECSPKSQG